MSTIEGKKSTNHRSNDNPLEEIIKRKRGKRIWQSALASLILAVVWITCTMISIGQTQETWSDIEYLRWVSQPDIFYSGGYIAATVMTALAGAVFITLFIYFYERNKIWSIIGIIFVPVYLFINIFGYSLQISIVPSMAAYALDTTSETLFVNQMLVASNDYTILGLTNAAAVLLLSVSTTIFGYMLIKDSKKISGVLLILHSVLCLFGVIGFWLENSTLYFGNSIGGLVYVVALIFLIIEFNKKDKKAKVA